MIRFSSFPFIFTTLFVTPTTFLHAQKQIDETKLLMQLDREFDKATAARGIEGWVSYFAPNGSIVGDTSQPVTGPIEIRKTMEPLFNDTTFSLRWQPTKSEMLIPGMLGYTIGRYVRLKEVKGRLMKWTGSYSTLWMKQPDGTWKAVFDTGTADGPAVEVK